jgi:hypothetical protein
MYILYGLRRDEFLACPELIRFAESNSGSAVVQLLAKTTTLAAKYLVRVSRIRLAVVRVREFLLYGLQFADGDEVEPIRWSLYEETYEIEAIRRLANQTRICISVFTEIAVNVSFGVGVSEPAPAALSTLIEGVTPYPFRREGVEESVAQEADELLLGLVEGTLPQEKGCFIDVSPPADWSPVTNHLIADDASRWLISLFDTDEGGQQEALAHWLSHQLDPDGVTRSPQVHEGKAVRELTDILLTYPEGPVLIESKALSILTREALPPRSKLAAQVVKHAKKAAGQLLGANKGIRRGLAITDREGRMIKVERIRPAHLIILIPELSLLSVCAEDLMPLYQEVMQASGGFLHILDPVELLRMVQAARAISKAGKTTTPMMAFDHYLIRRAERVIEVGHPNIAQLLRMEPPERPKRETNLRAYGS